jgi:hypothetical protein
MVRLFVQPLYSSFMFLVQSHEHNGHNGHKGEAPFTLVSLVD